MSTLKGIYLREYTKSATTKVVNGVEKQVPAHKVYVYGVFCEDAELLQSFVDAKGDNIRYDDVHDCPLHFVSESQYTGDVIDLVIYKNGKIEQDTSSMRRLKASTTNRGGDFASVINADASRAMSDIANANSALVAKFLKKDKSW